MLDRVTTQYRRLSFSPPRSPEPLAKTGYRRRGPNLGHAFHTADVDPELQRVRADRGGGFFPLFERCLGFLTDFLGKVAVVRPEFIGNSCFLTATAQPISKEFNRISAVGKHKIVCSSQSTKEVRDNRCFRHQIGYVFLLIAGVFPLLRCWIEETPNQHL